VDPATATPSTRPTAPSRPATPRRTAGPAGCCGDSGIVVPHLSDAQAAKTLAHELAHVTLHDNPQSLGGCRDRVEIEAESVAWILCRTAGFDSAAYSFGYVAHWPAGDPKAVRDTAERVVAAARELLEPSGLGQPAVREPSLHDRTDVGRRPSRSHPRRTGERTRPGDEPVRQPSS
jgi:hypothetical protein